MNLAQDWDKVSLLIEFGPEQMPVHYFLRLDFEEDSDEVNVAGVWSSLLATINSGGAGSDTFAPEMGSAHIVNGPNGDEAQVHEYVWEIAMGGVSAVFLRCMVERLRLVQPNQLRHLTMTARSKRQQPPSVDAAQVRTMLRDPTAYPKLWPQTSYAVERLPKVGTSSEFMLELTPAGALTPQLVAELQSLIVCWLDAISDYASDILVTGEQSSVIPSSFFGIPKFANNRTTLRAYIGQFLHTREPAIAMLRNMVECFHNRIASIARLRVVG